MDSLMTSPASSRPGPPVGGQYRIEDSPVAASKEPSFVYAGAEAGTATVSVNKSAAILVTIAKRADMSSGTSFLFGFPASQCFPS